MNSIPVTSMVLLGVVGLGHSVSVLARNEAATAPPGEGTGDLVGVLETELQRSMTELAAPDGARPYFLAYTVTAEERLELHAELGALSRDDHRHDRYLDVDLRVGSYQLDSSHKLRGKGGMSWNRGQKRRLVLEDDPAALQTALWRTTDRVFKDATEAYAAVQTNIKTRVAEEDHAGDFSVEQPSVRREPPAVLQLDREAWSERVRQVSRLARREPLLRRSSVFLSARSINRTLVTSEGSRLVTGQKFLRVGLQVTTRADDGMDLDHFHAYDTTSEEKLPSAAEMERAFATLVAEIKELRSAPLVEPYAGPAVLKNRAAAVFFHEVYGHRIEGHRQKDVEEGQTFAKQVGQSILPAFLSVTDDPTLVRFGQQDLRGHYSYDDEGVPATRVELVKNGVLERFLMARSPLKGFTLSNGHGRRQPGFSPVARQGNLIISSRKQIPAGQLRTRLIQECQRQGKPFGLVFEDISGGFTMTQRWTPQAFKVKPVLVYKVYADGRPDQLVRGVDIVGTPLVALTKILVTGDDPAVFNGTCGAESGQVPVSAIAPSLLVSQIEIEKRRRGQERPPILPPPTAEPSPEQSPAKVPAGAGRSR